MIKIDVKEKKGIVIVSFSGDLTSVSVHAIEDDIKEAIKRESAILGFNMDGVENIDSTGIGYLVKVKSKFLRSDQKMILYSVPVRILELFYIAQIDTLFDIKTGEEFEKEYLSGE